MEEFVLSGANRRIKAVYISREEKLDWIGRHRKHFEIIDQTYQHPNVNTVARRLCNVIRQNFDYSPKTNDCDLVWTWLQLYREHKLELENQKTMSDTFDYTKLTDRIKAVFNNSAYEAQWDIVREIFPEIYEEWKNDSWNRQYIIGHVYMRREQSFSHVVSLLMPVKIFGRHTHHDGDIVRLLNLITGTFWEFFVPHETSDKNLTVDEWGKLTRNIDGESFIHLGEFSHSQYNAYLQGEHQPFILHEESELTKSK